MIHIIVLNNILKQFHWIQFKSTIYNGISCGIMTIKKVGFLFQMWIWVDGIGLLICGVVS